MDVLSDINSSTFLAPELEKAASRRVYADFQYSWSKRTMLALVDSSQTTQRTVQRQLSMSENSSCASCDLNSETSTECTTPTSTYQTQGNLVFRRKQSIKRTYAFNELIDTERVYVNDLHVMIEIYFSAMQKQKWISREDVQIITRNVNEILILHTTLLKKLEACSQNFHWENIYNRYCQLADVFVEMGPSFMIYAEFCGSHEHASKVCASYQTRPEWIVFSTMCLTESDSAPINDDVSSTASISTRLRLEDYLIKPVQRICRYQLLIKEILKSSDPSSPEYDKLKNAYDIMQYVVTSVDERKNQQDLADRSQLVLNRLEDDCGLAKVFVSSLGNLSMSGALEVTYAADGLPASKTRYMGCFLYSSYMIIVKAKKHNIYEAKHWFPINIFEVRDLPDTEGFSASSFMLVSKGHVFEFSASCQQEKQLWMKALRSNIISAQMIIDENSKTDKIGKVVPVSFYYKPREPYYVLRTCKSQSNIDFDTNPEDSSEFPIRRSRSITVQCSKSIDNLMLAAGYPSQSFGGKLCSRTRRRSSVDQIFRSRSLLKRIEAIESNYTMKLLSTTPSPFESTIEHGDTVTDISLNTLATVKRISQTHLAQQHAIKIAIDQKFNDVCTQDYLSSRAWHARERNTGWSLRKRKSLPFIRTSASNMLLTSAKMKRRISDVGQSGGRQSSLGRNMSEIPIDDYVTFQKALAQRSETSRRPSLTCQAIKNNWSRISGFAESKVDELIESNPASPTEMEHRVAPWEKNSTVSLEYESDHTLYQPYTPNKEIESVETSVEKLVPSLSEQSSEENGAQQMGLRDQSMDADRIKEDERYISKTLNFCKPKRAVSAPLSPKPPRTSQRSQRSKSLLLHKSIALAQMSDVPNQVSRRPSLHHPLRRTIEISQPTSFAYSSTPPSTPKTPFFDSFKLKQILWWK